MPSSGPADGSLNGDATGRRSDGTHGARLPVASPSSSPGVRLGVAGPTDPESAASSDRLDDLVLDPDHPRYPKSLLLLRDPPQTLYARGDLSVLELPIAAIVGSRDPTNYGIKIAYDAAREAARAGIVVVSGVARGLDGRAHRGALDAGGMTIGVLGCGFDVAYPRENLDLLRAIPENGLLLSELPPGTRPTQWSFPARNRLIAALAKCLLVVEGQQAGGTNNTVWWMQQLDKTVLAVPGRIDEPVAAGPNGLIWDLATPYLSPVDLLEQFGLTWELDAARLAAYPGAMATREPRGSAGPRRAPCVPSDRRRAGGATGEQRRGLEGRRAGGATGEPRRSCDRRESRGATGEQAGGCGDAVRPARDHIAPEPLDPAALAALGEFAAAEATVFDLITPDAVHVDRIADRAGLDPGTLLAALSSLEIKGLVTQLPGKQFRLAS